MLGCKNWRPSPMPYNSTSILSLTLTPYCTFRYYIQPQWVFDCVNSRSLLPVEDYFPGTMLPPHLSPFVEEGEGDYIPPERQRLIDRERGLDSGMSQCLVSNYGKLHIFGKRKTSSFHKYIICQAYNDDFIWL